MRGPAAVGFRQAIGNFQRAVAADPDYAAAYASLSIAYNIAPGYLGNNEIKALPSHGRAEAEKALKLDAGLGNGHMALALVSTGEFNWEEAEREFKRAFQANPNNAAAHYFFAQSVLLAEKRYDEAMPEYRKALAVDPLSGIINTNYGFALMIAKRFDEARAQLAQTLALDPNFAVALDRSAELEAYEGNYKEALEFRERGYPDLAKKNIQPQKEAYYRSYGQSDQYGLRSAVAASMLGEKDRAFLILEKAVAVDGVDLTTWIRRPEFDGLRSDPRYPALMRRVNLPE